MKQLSLTGRQWKLRMAAPDRPLNAEEAFALLTNERSIMPGAALKLTAPMAFDDMPRAVERVKQAIEKNEKIGIFGDYDCDGITAVSILIRYFRRRGVEPLVRLPHRVRDGYGLNSKIVQELISSEIKVLITADTGVASIDEITELQNAGVDVIVTDHHRPAAEVPPAYALLHPALSARYQPPYPSGAGVALQFVRALEGREYPGMATDWGLAALGTVADLVELRGDNRTIVHHGLRALNTAPLEGGLRTLIDDMRAPDAPLTSIDIGFRIAPRINAAGRMDDPTIALRALLEGGNELLEIQNLNTERQKKTAMFVDEALAQFVGTTIPPFLILVDERYPHGLLGLIAGKLTETFGRPSMVATVEDGMCTASLRSPPCYNVTEGLERSRHLLQRFGGHAQAAGCSFELSTLEALSASLTMDVLATVAPEELGPTLEVDAILDAAHITVDFYEKILSLEPFGQGNSEPRFLLKGVQIDMPKKVGGDEKHLQLRLNGKKGIAFNLGHLIEHTLEPVDVVARIGLDTWQGRRAPQLFIEDIGISKKVTVG